MTAPLEPELYGHTIFCDDVRREDTGKFIYIGVYPGNMTVFGDFPVTVPKFVILPSIFCRMGTKHLEVELMVSFPGDEPGQPSIKTAIVLPDIPAPPPASEGEEWPAADVHRLDMPLVMAPFVIKQRGLIRVRAQHGGQVTKLGTLRIDKGTLASTPAAS